MSDRRRHYRVRPELDALVRIELTGPRLRARNVVLLDLSAAGAGLELPAGARGMLQDGDLVDLLVRSTQLLAPLSMRGRLCHVDETGPVPRVGMRFVDWRQHRVLLDSALKGLFNEREAYRVEPELRRPVLAEVQVGGLRLKGRLRDLSVLGAGLWLEGPSGLSTQQVITLRLQLPEPHLLVQVEAEVCHHRTTDREAAVGLRLLGDRQDAMRLQREISPYVMERQRSLARMGLAALV